MMTKKQARQVVSDLKECNWSRQPERPNTIICPECERLTLDRLLLPGHWKCSNCSFTHPSKYAKCPHCGEIGHCGTCGKFNV